MPCARDAFGRIRCSECGHERPCSGVRTGKPRCAACVRRRAVCSYCVKVAKVSVVWAAGPICTTCRYNTLETRSICSGCGQSRRPDPRHRSGQCSDCVGLPPFNICVGCGREERLYRGRRCYACILAEDIDALLGASPRLKPLRKTLLDTERPRSVLRWLRSDATQHVLGRIVTGDLELTHAAIDSLGESVFVLRLRRLASRVVGSKSEAKQSPASSAGSTHNSPRSPIPRSGEWSKSSRGGG